MLSYLQFIKEHKFWKKSLEQFFSWLRENSSKKWVLLDTETTGLPSDPYEVQLTQVACIVIDYNFETNTYNEIANYNKKIKLTTKTLDLMKSTSGSRIKQVLDFNHYEKSGLEYFEENETLKEFFEFLSKYENPLLVIQNAKFDMRFLNTRNPIVKFDNDVLDTKQVAQLFFLPLLQTLAYKSDEVVDKLKMSIASFKEGSSERTKLENKLHNLLKKLGHEEFNETDAGIGQGSKTTIDAQGAGIESGETKESGKRIQGKNFSTNPFREMVDSIGTSERDNGLISSSLSKIGPLFKMDMTDYHDALKDCQLMIQMFTKMIDFMKEYDYVDISQFQNERIEKIKNPRL